MDSPFESSDDNSVQEENSGEEESEQEEQEEGTTVQEDAQSSASEDQEKSSSGEESAEEQAPAQSESDEEEAQVNEGSGGDSSDGEEETVKTAEQDGSESEEEEEQVQEEDLENKETEKSDLFGGADDISSSDEEKVESHQEDNDNNNEERALAFSDDDENEGEETVKQQAEEEPEQQETRIEVEIPRINTDLGKGIHFVRFPNFVSVETRPFDPAVYEDEIEDDELMDEEGRTRMKLKVENTIRWKKYTDENGINITESNARLIKWSDGSLSMNLGSEIFDVHAMPLQGDHNHLFIRQGTGLQGQAVFKTKLTFRPHSTKSATHRKMTSRLAMRLNQNQQKVRVLPIAGQDPESRKAKLMKEEEDQLRAHMRREAQKRRMREKAHAKGLHANYLDDRLDEEEDTGAISVSAIKNRFKPGFGTGRGIYTSDSDSGDEKQLTNAKKIESDDDSDEDRKGKDKSEEGEKKKKNYISDSDSEEEAAATTADSGDVAMESQEHSSNSD